MAQIPQYARKSLTSSYVGAPVDSHRGDVAAAAGDGLGKLSTVVGAQLQATAKQQAATALYRYQQNYSRALAGTDKEQGLADQYSDDPLSLPQASIKMGEELASEMTKGLNKRAQTEFSTAVKGFLMSENNRLTGLAMTQNKANQVVAMQEGLMIVADDAANKSDLEGIHGVMNGLYETAFDVDDGKGAVSPKARASLFSKSFDAAKKNFINSRLLNDPVRFAGDLNEGVYESIYLKDRKVPFIGGDEARRYISMARSIAKNRDEQKTFDFAISNGEIALQLVDKYNANQLSLADVETLEFQARELKQSEVADMYKSFRDIILSGNDTRRVTDTPWMTQVSEEIMNMSHKRKRKKIPPQDRLMRGFGIIKEANEKFAANELTRSDHTLVNEMINANIFVPAAKSSEGTTPFLQGLTQIRDHLMAAKGLSESERVDMFADGMRDYYGVIKGQGVKNLTVEQAKTAAGRAIEAIKSRANPGYSSLEVGDTIPTPTGMRKMVGKDGLGNPIVEFTGEDVRNLNY